MKSFLLLLTGSGIGGTLRYAVSLAMTRRWGAAFPYHTLTINVVGSLFMGLLAAYFIERSEAAESWKLLLMTGVLGGFTTFSAFSLEAATLYRNGHMTAAIVYVLASVLGSLAAVFVGLHLLRLRTS